MKGKDLIRWIAYHDMWDADVLVSFLHDEVNVLSEIKSVCSNGKAMQLNEIEFDTRSNFRRENV